MDISGVDVVVIGGGVQGLVILDSLIAAGYSCALVTEGDLGSGQTLHSHGFLNTGFGLEAESFRRRQRRSSIPICVPVGSR
jgi:glycine/D-amino acid oxidase-like deaminating enzyme